MDISKIIKTYRKKENLTQEQIAKYLNISKSAVNKWENNISYPDISLLAPLSRILNIDINTLLSFNEELSEIEIKAITREFSEFTTKEGIEKAFEKADKLFKNYPNTDQLIYWILGILRIYLGKEEFIEKNKYEEKIISWIKVLTTSNKEKVATMAKLDLSVIYKNKKKYKEAQNLLNEIPQFGLDNLKKIQQGQLFEEVGEFYKAYDNYENILRSSGFEAFTAFNLMAKLAIKENNFFEAEKYIIRGKSLVDVFELGEYYKHTLDLSLGKAKNDKEQIIIALVNMVKYAETMDSLSNSSLYKHRVLDKTNTLDKNKYKNIVKEAIKKDKSLDFVKNHSKIKFLLE